MDWSLLLLLACPLMMLVCMKGMFTGNKDSKAFAQSNTSQHEIQQMQIQMADLMEQNQKLMKEMESVKGTSPKVVELNEHPKRAL
jgi:hypothetical protein